MDIELINEIIDCMPKERTKFHYFKDRYAFMLLERFIGKGETVSNIKKSLFSGLLEKPDIKLVLSMIGKGYLTPEILNSVWPKETYNFLLTLGCWGSNSYGWDQTSRRGYNLVLQLNFSNQHDDFYQKMVKPNSGSLLNSYSHPILELDDRRYFRETLAWSRIDLDFSQNEALIEEIQCDWLRKARRLLRTAKFHKKHNSTIAKGWALNGSLDNIINYCEEFLSPYNKIWSEAMLSATIDFIEREMGINNIYFHSENTGHKVKKIKFSKPPRSIYSKLPRQFCFTKTKNAPEFLNGDKQFKRMYRKVANPEWYRMTV